jgi:ribonuclease P protein component
MLSRTQRIKKKEFNTAPYRFIKAPLFSLKVKKNTLMRYRFGFVISKKLDSRAVVRNTLKRRICAAVSDLGKPTQGYDIVFFPKKELLDISVVDIGKSIKDVVQKQQLV